MTGRATPKRAADGLTEYQRGYHAGRRNATEHYESAPATPNRVREIIAAVILSESFADTVTNYDCADEILDALTRAGYQVTPRA